ncbi:FAD-dependent oxidoreductase [Myxococcota bacterium]|nr:FAD-dependent oxidoreductase [Myxococcota bacterium]
MTADAAHDSRSPRAAATITHYDDEADVVVVGYGIAGASCAIEAAALGADVLVTERASAGGGTSANSGGLIYMGGGTALQTALGFEDTPEEMFKYLMAACGPAPDESLVAPFVEHSVDHFDWFIKQGVFFKEAFFPDAHEPETDESLTYSGSEDCHPFSTIAKPAPRGHCASVMGSKGAILMNSLIESAQRSGVRVRGDHLAERLITESDGRVVGVVLRHAGEEICVRARRGVALTAGGFIWNDEMLERHAPWLRRCKMKVGTENDDGSAIQMGIAVGAATIRMDSGDITLPIFPPVSLKQGLLVNANAQRFLNEDAYMGRWGEFSLLHQDGQAWLIVDEKSFGQTKNIPDLQVMAGETIQELEAEIGMPTGALQQTVAFYNEHAKHQRDPLFHKHPSHVRPLEHPPFGALDLRPEHSVYCGFTLGGLHIDSHGRVKTPGGEPIPGLHAAGRTTSGISKQGYSSGISLGDGSFFGRRAGQALARAKPV